MAQEKYGMYVYIQNLIILFPYRAPADGNGRLDESRQRLSIQSSLSV